MTRLAPFFGGVVASLCVACGEETQFLAEHDSIDLLIENGLVVDGLGGDPFGGDVVVVGDTIAFVGDAEFADDDPRVRRRIDAAGRVVAPGFIDLHSHGDPLSTPEMENFLAMGVTTVTLGQDGSSPDVQPLSNWLDDVRQQGIGTNLAMFIGHGTLRNQAGIGMAPVPESEALARMLDDLDDALDYTFGLSTGLEYNPGLNAETAELEALAQVVGANDRMIMSHMRNEDDHALEDSIAELLQQGRYSRVHVSHLKSVYGKGSGRAEELLALLENARDLGIEVTADVYPYIASYTGIAIVFPVWAKTSEQFEVAKAERREELEDYLRNRIEQRNGPEATLIGTGRYTGKTLADIAHELEMPFEQVLIDEIGPQGASGAYFVMNDELQSRLLQDPSVGVCSDGSPTGFHPRGHGTFARMIERYVVDRQVLSLAAAVHKMTSFAASVLRLPERGSLAVGKVADIIVFDPESVHENATFPEPLQLADGFDIVIVNGVIAREGGVLSTHLPGRVLAPTECAPVLIAMGHSDEIQNALARHDRDEEIVERADEVMNFLESPLCAPRPMMSIDEAAIVLDLSRGSQDLGEPLSGLSVSRMSQLIDQRLCDAGTDHAFGRWGERRELYASDLFVVDDSSPKRDVHLGVDVFCASGGVVSAPLPGKVHVCANNARELDYGPLIILQHQTPGGAQFYTLYGHLALASVARWREGQTVAAGEPLAAVGAPPENGNWPAHLHFQIILDLLGEGRDFPGVALHEQRSAWFALSPLPTRFFPPKFANALDGSERATG